MSWVEWQGEKWPTTADVAEMRVLLWRPDAPHARAVWRWELFHMDRTAPGASNDASAPWLDIELAEFFLPAQRQDWRHFAGWEVRADAAWRESQEYTSEFGRHDFPEIRLSCPQAGLAEGAERKLAGADLWFADQFLLRFDARDGWGFSCELDAWMIPEEEYERLTPEAPEEAERFPTEPPNLRVITRAEFQGGAVYVPRRYHADPVAWAREELRTEIRCDTMEEVEVKWALRQAADRSEIVELPGWGSTVSFRTEPWPKEQGAAPAAKEEE